MLPFVITYGAAAGAGARSKWPLVGQLTVSGITYGSARWANLGYWVDEQYAGRGIVPTAVALAADHCFHPWPAPDRGRDPPGEQGESAGRGELGFRYEGERPRFLHIDGDWRDHRIFALNVEEVGPGLVARLG